MPTVVLLLLSRQNRDHFDGGVEVLLGVFDGEAEEKASAKGQFFRSVLQL